MAIPARVSKRPLAILQQDEPATETVGSAGGADEYLAETLEKVGGDASRF